MGISFTQNTSTSSGSNSGTATGVSAGTYTATILNNSGGFTVQNGGKKLCFKDLDGNDCNAEVVVTVGQTNGIIASSLDLNTLGDEIYSGILEKQQVTNTLHHNGTTKNQ